MMITMVHTSKDWKRQGRAKIGRGQAPEGGGRQIHFHLLGWLESGAVDGWEEEGAVDVGVSDSEDRRSWRSSGNLT